MLTELIIRDFAIIDQLHLELGNGFVALTGETGAGKSIIIDAVEVLLGGRAESTMIRQGADTALIEGEFRLNRDEVLSILAREQLLEEGPDVRLGREIRRNGRNVARVNGRAVTNSLLQEIGEWLVDVHGQSEHLSLLRLPEHLRLLDRYGEVDARRYVELFEEQQVVRHRLHELKRGDRDATQRAEFLRFQRNEIESARLVEGEEEELQEEHSRLAHADQLARLIDESLAEISQDHSQEAAASDRMSKVVAAMQQIAEIDPSMTQARDEAQVVLEGMAELASRLRVYGEEVEHNPKRLETVEQRLALLRDLQRKYGEGIPAILAHAERAREELETLEGAEERIQSLEAQIEKLEGELAQLGQELSQERAKAAERLCVGIERELGDLGMQGAGFRVDSQWKEDDAGLKVNGRSIAFGPSGLDHIEFLVAPNLGEGLKSLRKIASGGETSRLMLALKGVLARADHTPTLIFDEIDQGIGGRVGAVVGSKLWELGRTHQVLCITHLPQLAAHADAHIKVEKRVQGGRTRARAGFLEGEARVAELAVMLGAETETNRVSALELLQSAQQAREGALVGT